jgi:hypothetical protein
MLALSVATLSLAAGSRLIAQQHRYDAAHSSIQQHRYVLFMMLHAAAP